MKKALIHEKLADAKEYIHVNCTEHNDKTAYCNAIKKVYGPGNKILRNTTQFAHSFLNTQESFPGGSKEIKPLMRAA